MFVGYIIVVTKVIGIDLAGMPKNDTGFCVLEINENKFVRTKILHDDEEIITSVRTELPDLVCIDGPITLPRRDMRKCDVFIKEYGGLPPLLGGMRYLTMRGNKIGGIVSKEFKTIEVYTRASAKILGFYNEDGVMMQKELIKMGLEGDIIRRNLTKDEVDAVIAAITGYLYTQGKAREVGDDEGKIILPKV